MKSSTGRNECYRNIGEVHSGKQVGAKMKFFDNECHVRELLACSFNLFFFYFTTLGGCWWHGFEFRRPF